MAPTQPVQLTITAIIEPQPIITPFKSEGNSPNPVPTEGQLWPRGNS